MKISVYSVLASAIWVSILILVLLIAYRRRNIWRYCGIGTLIIIYLFCCVRLLLPIDFPWTVNVWSYHIGAAIRTWLVTPRTFFGREIVLANVLLATWIVGVVVALCHYIARFYYLNRYINRLIKNGGTESDISSFGFSTEKARDRVKVWRVKELGEPVGVGLLKYNILLPDADYSEEAERCVVRHEYMHYKNHDTWMKLLLNLLCALYWWNPFMYLFKRSMNQMFEVRCDAQCVDGLDNNGKIEYLETIVDVMKERTKRNRELQLANSFLGLKDESTLIKERFEFIIKGLVKNGDRRTLIGTFMASAVVLFISYTFILKPGYHADIVGPEEDPSTIIEITNENAHLRHYRNDVYTILFNEGDPQEDMVHNMDLIQVMIKKSHFKVEEMDSEYYEE